MKQSDKMFLAGTVATGGTYYGIAILRYLNNANMDGGVLIISLLVGIIAALLITRQTVKIDGYKCSRCGAEFVPKQGLKNPPAHCPKCNNPNWWKPRKEKK